MIPFIVLLLVVIATAVMLVNLFFELSLIAGATQYLIKATSDHRLGQSQLRDNLTVGVVLIYVLIAHLAQIAAWAVAFMWCGEFDDFATAYYHSAVNFASLGYGDIVMSEEWRLLGALEAAVGVMMFGVSAALLFAIIREIIRNRFQEIATPKPDA